MQAQIYKEKRTDKEERRICISKHWYHKDAAIEDERGRGEPRPHHP